MKRAALILLSLCLTFAAFPSPCLAAQPPFAAGQSIEEQALRLAAQKGDANAQYDLAVALLKPIPPHSGPIPEGREAADLLQKSALQGNMNAAFLLGYINQYGVGVPKSTAEAVPWFTKAADGGNVSAMVALGVMYRVGDGIAADKGKAQNYYAKAAAKGNNNARTALASMYMDGDGVQKDGAKARELLKPAVDGGHAPAMLALGKLYAVKDLGMVNGSRAVYWTHQAVAHGHAPAVYALGLLYRDGVGDVKPDAYKAYLWLRLTYELSGKVSGTSGGWPYWLDNANRVLTPEQRKQAEAELGVWLQQGPPAPPATEPR